MTTYDFDTKSSHRPRFQYTDEGIDWYIIAHQFNTNHQLVEQCNSEFLSKPVLNEPEEWHLKMLCVILYGTRAPIEVTHIAYNKFGTIQKSLRSSPAGSNIYATNILPAPAIVLSRSQGRSVALSHALNQVASFKTVDPKIPRTHFGANIWLTSTHTPIESSCFCYSLFIYGIIILMF